MIKFTDKLLLIVVAVFILSSYKASSQDEIFLKDTIVKQGSIFSIPIYGTINSTEPSDIKISIVFNWKLIDIKQVTGSDNYAMKCPVPDFNVILTDKPDSTILEIYCDNVQKLSDGTICSLKMEALAGNDSSAMFLPLELYINGTKITDAGFHASKIKIEGSIVFEKQLEGLFRNYPNPFDHFSFFPFALQDSTTVRFFIYNSGGYKIVSSEDDFRSFGLEISDSNDVPVADIHSGLPGGKYMLTLVPNIYYWASGKYYITLETKNGFYSRNFLYLK